jgi:murein DD-endopeptidase MepM/ murein hydrolase activator NlpD
MIKHILYKAKKVLVASCCTQFLIIILSVGIWMFMEKPRTIGAATISSILSSSTDKYSVQDLATQFAAFLPQDGNYTPLPEPETIRHVVSPGETLSAIWKKYSNVTDGSDKAAQAFKQAGLPLSSIKSGEIIRIKLSSLGYITGLRKNVEPAKVLVLEQQGLGEFKANIRERRIRSNNRTASGFIVHSFADSARERGIPYEVIDDLVDIFGSRIEFRRDLQPGDTFTVIYSEERLPNGKFIKAGPIKAAAITKGGKREVAIRYNDNKGAGVYYNQNGEQLGNYFLRYPVKFSRISSSFSSARFHPVLKIKRPHNGVDFAAPIGTPVRTIADGIVTYAGYNRGGGYTVKVKHSPRYSTAYLHLQKIESGIRVGTRVSRADQIGRVGMSGLATGPHLHFSFYDNNNYVDPMKVNLPSLSNSNQTIPASYLKAVLAELDKSTDGLRLAYKQAQSKSVG